MDHEESEWQDSRNWRGGMFYVAPGDRRVWVPKRPPGIGWTLNFARPASWAWLAALVAVPVGTIMFTISTIFDVATKRGH